MVFCSGRCPVILLLCWLSNQDVVRSASLLFDFSDFQIHFDSSSWKRDLRTSFVVILLLVDVTGNRKEKKSWKLWLNIRTPKLFPCKTQFWIKLASGVCRAEWSCRAIEHSHFYHPLKYVTSSKAVEGKNLSHCFPFH